MVNYHRTFEASFSAIYFLILHREGLLCVLGSIKLISLTLYRNSMIATAIKSTPDIAIGPEKKMSLVRLIALDLGFFRSNISQ